MISSSPRLREYLTGSDDDESMYRINLKHMQLYLAWASSAARLANKPIRYEVQDEVDKFPKTAGKREADPSSKGEKRLRTYRYIRKLWKTSTPTIEDGPIWQALMTECEVIFDFYVPCPDCHVSQYMYFHHIKWPEGERDPKRIYSQDMAYYECPHCGSKWDDYRRNMAIKKGVWKSRPLTDDGRQKEEAHPEGKEELYHYLQNHRPKAIGFHLPGWYSRFVGISEAAAAFLKGNHDKNKLKDFKNSFEAVPWKDYTVERSEDRILNLKDERPEGIVPGENQVAAIVAGIDTQDTGFWYAVRAFGWGMEQESWSVRYGFVDSFEALRVILLDEAYLDTEGNDYTIRIALQDAMGHKTSDVYDFVRMHPGKIFATQGVDTGRMTQPFTWTKIDFYPPDKSGRKRPMPGGLNLLRVNVNHYKNLVSGKLEIKPNDPGAFHLHGETTDEYARHMVAEHIDPDTQIWVNPAGRDNHLWDCETLCFAAADLLRIRFWKKTADERQETRDKRRETDNKEGKTWLPRKHGGWINRQSRN